MTTSSGILAPTEYSLPGLHWLVGSELMFHNFLELNTKQWPFNSFLEDTACVFILFYLEKEDKYFWQFLKVTF